MAQRDVALTTLVLNRFVSEPEGSFGEIKHNDHHVCFTVERAWHNNSPFRSCVPTGVYSLLWRESPKWGWRLHLEGETVSVTRSSKQRWACLIHPANHPAEVQGCIAPNRELRFRSDTWAGVLSAQALSRVESLCPEGEDHQLIILPGERRRDAFER